MPLRRFTAGLLLFSERSDGDVINLRSCVNFRLLSRQRNYGTSCLLRDKVFGFSEQRVTESVLKINEEISWVSLIYDDLLVLSTISFKFCFYIFYFIQHGTATDIRDA